MRLLRSRSLFARPSLLRPRSFRKPASRFLPGMTESRLLGFPTAERFLLPLKKFTDHAKIGVVNVATDQTGTPRSVPMLFRTDDMVEMSFPLRVAALAVGKEPAIEPDRLTLGQRSVPIDVDHALPITFYGPRRTIRTISAASVLAGDIASDDIRNRIVVLGATVSGGGDFFSTPFEPLLPGVEVISTAITHLVAGDGRIAGSIRSHCRRHRCGLAARCSCWSSRVASKCCGPDCRRGRRSDLGGR